MVYSNRKTKLCTTWKISLGPHFSTQTFFVALVSLRSHCTKISLVSFSTPSVYNTQTRVCRKCAYICARTWFLSSFITSRTPTPFTAFDAYNTLHPLFPPSPLNQRLHYFLPLEWLYHLCRSSNVDCRVPWYYRRRVGILMVLVVNDFSDFYETLIAPFSNVHLMSL